MKAVSQFLWLVFLAALITGCASSGQTKSEEAAPVLEANDRVDRLTKENQALLIVIRSLKPEAFEAVGLYRIQPGDTGSKIARKHGITLVDLVALNPDVNWTMLKVWQVVRVRPATEKKEPNQ